MRQELEKYNARMLVVAILDEIAWLFNLHSANIEFNRAFFGYVVVTRQGDHACHHGAGQPGRAVAAWAGGSTASV